ncbi:MAG TPA: MFS transporter [Bryobacteraceae bacterium]|nr:MFS transporter [Bryobacteraceae bacterium]
MSASPAAAADEAYSSREQKGWYFYDFANSGFSTTVVTLFLGPYLTAIAKASADASGFIRPFGIAVEPRAYWGYLVAISVVLQVICLPVLGAMADYSHRKKQLLALFAYAGAFATSAMFLIHGNSWLLGGGLFLFANLTFGASIVIYNSFLPDIAAPEDRDAISSKGWGIGYLGGGLLLALNLLLYTKAAAFGISEAMAIRISLCSAGLWWAIFTIIPLMTLRNRGMRRLPPAGQHYITAAMGQLASTIKDIRKYPQTLTFLIAYLVYNDAIQTVITISSQFGNDELKIPMSSLTLAILMVQFVAFLGAIGFNYLAKWIGAKNAVMWSLIVWSGVLVAIYFTVRTTAQFFLMAAVVAVVLGGSQALSRSLYSLMIPKGREGEYFSLYEISDKGTSWLGPLAFALALQFTHSYRLAILSLILFFLVGLAILSRVDVRRAATEAGNA